MTSTVQALMPAHAIIAGTHSGVVSASDLRNAARETFALCQEHDVWRVLTDCHDVTQAPGAIDLLNLLEAMGKAGVDQEFRQALVWPTDMQARLAFDVWKTGEQNRGYHAQAFTDRDAAIAWLESDDPGSSSRGRSAV